MVYFNANQTKFQFKTGLKLKLVKILSLRNLDDITENQYNPLIYTMPRKVYNT